VVNTSQTVASELRSFSSLERTRALGALACYGLHGLAPGHPIRLALQNTLDPSFFSARGGADYPCPEGRLEQEFLGFNSQAIRSRLLLDLLSGADCDAVIETGAFRAETTLLLAVHTDITVCTCEVEPVHYSLAGAMIEQFSPRPVDVANADSRAFLSALPNRLRLRRPLFYIDSHWHGDWPLLDELRIIGGRYQQAVVVIDDVRVPGDNGFGYDTYDSQRLEWAYISQVVGDNFTDWAVYYPSYPSTLETGYRRGMLVLAVGNFCCDHLARAQARYRLKSGLA
jgi:hypothetical protein